MAAEHWKCVGRGPVVRYFVGRFMLRLYVDTIVQGAMTTAGARTALYIARLGLFALTVSTARASCLSVHLMFIRFVRPVRARRRIRRSGAYRNPESRADLQLTLHARVIAAVVATTPARFVTVLGLDSGSALQG